jgi:hypothetical protein
MSFDDVEVRVQKDGGELARAFDARDDVVAPLRCDVAAAKATGLDPHDAEELGEAVTYLTLTPIPLLAGTAIDRRNTEEVAKEAHARGPLRGPVDPIPFARHVALTVAVEDGTPARACARVPALRNTLKRS